jgi:hypothetical protein
MEQTKIKSRDHSTRGGRVDYTTSAYKIQPTHRGNQKQERSQFNIVEITTSHKFDRLCIYWATYNYQQAISLSALEKP